jgi:SPX domain protein involved in polyphosphate accumulation
MFSRKGPKNNAYPAVVSQRFEAKYQINAAQAMAVRDLIHPYMDADPHGSAYPVTSIYLDSPDLAMYWSSARGEERRHKLRIRTYDGDGHETCFFEVKHRHNQIIRKDRAVVRMDSAQALLSGAPTHPDMLANPGRDMENLYTFQDLLARYNATPRLVVRYMREAHMSKMDEPLRITFDTQITCLPSERFDPKAWFASPYWFEPPNLPIVLEVKFTDSFPGWVEDIVCRLNLRRDSFSKYVICADSLRQDGVDIAHLEGARF